MSSLFPRLFLIDGSAMAYRSHFALMKSGLSNSQGEPTGAIFGSLNQLISLMDRESPEHIAVVFDASGPTFRHDMYEEYKATREKMPDDLRNQLPIIKELIQSMGIPLLEQQGVEADDIIGTLATWGAQQGWEVMIVSGDKDFAQLVTDNVKLYDPGKGGSGPKVLGPPEVLEKFGVRPDQIIDYFALIGDSSDNVPGVPKIGPKTATKWMAEYDTLDAIYEHLEDLTKSQRTRLEENKDKALLSKKLVTILTDVEVECSKEALTRQKADHDALRSRLIELEFAKLLDRIVPAETMKAADVDTDYQIIDSSDQLQKMLHAIKEKGEVSLAGLYHYDNRVQTCLGLAFSTEPNTAWYLSLDDDATIASEQSLSALAEMLADTSVGKVGHDLKEIWIALAERGYTLNGITFDTMLASHLLAGSRTNHDLDAVALQNLGRRKTSETDILGSGRKKRTWPDVNEGERSQYFGEEADLALQCTQELRQRIEKLDQRQDLYTDFDLPLIPVLAQMERQGVAVDLERLEELRKETVEKLDELRETINKWAGDPDFNVQSPSQVGALLFDKLLLQDQFGLKVRRTAKTGAYKTDQETLEALSDHELPRMILQYRELQKRLSTYIEVLLDLAVPDRENTPRVHTRFRQTGAITGRLSSFSPNLQNIPARTPEGREIRRTFVAGPEDWLLVSADYSQIELRILAHISGDPGLQEAFEHGLDIHKRTASIIFGVFPDFVTPSQRNAAKAINFGIVYGMGPPRLAKQIDVSVREAGRFIKAYFKSYPKVKEYLDSTIEHARNHRYVETLFGRRREVLDINSRDPRVKAHNEHIAVNTPIQGTAADLIKKAMIQIAKRLRAEDFQSRMLLQIHDELLFEAPPSELERLDEMVRYEMRNAIQLDIPLVVDVGSGKNWADAH